MVVGTLRLDLRLDGCFSLKEKRHVLRGTLERLRRDYQVAAVSNDAQHVESILDHVVKLMDDHPEIEIVGEVRSIERT